MPDRMLRIAMTLFVVRGFFYCLLQPTWEGFDEWAHFGYIEQIARHGRLAQRTDDLSPEIRRSLEVFPLPYGQDQSPLEVTHEHFWKLPGSELLGRIGEMRKCCAERPKALTHLRQYEAQQPPLYYLLLAIPDLIFARAGIAKRVFVLGLVSLAIASFLIPITLFLAKKIFPSGGLAWTLVLGVMCMPGLYVDVCRVGNESLAIVLTSVFLLCCLRSLERTSGLASWILLGLSLGLALLTKAYALAFVPIPPVLGLIRMIRYRQPPGKTVGRVSIALAVALSVAGWWYWETWNATGTLSGEQVDAAAVAFTFHQKFAALAAIHWMRVLDSLASSYIWTSGWSFLVVRSWMYRIPEFLGLTALLGFLVQFRREPFGNRAVVAFPVLVLVLALAYQTVVIYLVRGVSTGSGWYFFASVTSQALLVAIGLQVLFGSLGAQAVLACFSLLAIVLDVYTVRFILAPYYSGMIMHDGSGHLSSFHLFAPGNWDAIQEILRRLSSSNGAFLSPAVFGLSWLAYVGATLSLAFLVVKQLVKPTPRGV